MEAPCCDVFELVDGRIKSFDCYPSLTVIMAQLGVLGEGALRCRLTPLSESTAPRRGAARSDAPDCSFAQPKRACRSLTPRCGCGRGGAAPVGAGVALALLPQAVAARSRRKGRGGPATSSSRRQLRQSTGIDAEYARSATRRFAGLF
jgi:hypothetical protein